MHGTLLMTKLERGLLRSEETAGAELVLQDIAARCARSCATEAARGNLSAACSFLPLELLFLSITVATHNHPDGIARVILEPVWDWVLPRYLMPAEAARHRSGRAWL